MKGAQTYRITLSESESIQWRDKDIIPQAAIARAEACAQRHGAPRCSIYTTFGNLALSVPAPVETP